MRPEGSAPELEKRRFRAIKLLQSGLSHTEVARRLGCDRSSVIRWHQAYKREGLEGLRPRPTPGRPRKLSRKQELRLVKMLLRGARAHGYSTDLWTTRRVSELVRRTFGVGYHHDHVGRILHRLGFSVQKPERRAAERDDEALRRWKRYRWPRVKKTPNA